MSVHVIICVPFLLLVVVNQYTLCSTLTINSLQLSDNGTYQCVASNINATTFSLYHLHFYGMYFSFSYHLLMLLFSFYFCSFLLSPIPLLYIFILIINLTLLANTCTYHAYFECVSKVLVLIFCMQYAQCTHVSL